MKWSRRAVWLPALLVVAVLAIAGPATAATPQQKRIAALSKQVKAQQATIAKRRGQVAPGVTPWYRVAFSPYLVPFRSARTGTGPGYAERPRRAFNRAEAKIATTCRNLGLRRLGPLDGRPGE